MLALGVLAPLTAEAKRPPHGVYNYVDGESHLQVWDGNAYQDMGHVDLP